LLYFEDWEEDEVVTEQEADVVDEFDIENEFFENIKLMKRIINFFVGVGVDIVGKLVKKLEFEFFLIKNFGAKAVDDVLSVLKERNLTLKAELVIDK